MAADSSPSAGSAGMGSRRPGPGNALVEGHPRRYAAAPTMIRPWSEWPAHGPRVYDPDRTCCDEFGTKTEPVLEIVMPGCDSGFGRIGSSRTAIPVGLSETTAPMSKGVQHRCTSSARAGRRPVGGQIVDLAGLGGRRPQTVAANEMAPNVVPVGDNPDGGDVSRTRIPALWGVGVGAARDRPVARVAVAAALISALTGCASTTGPKAGAGRFNRRPIGGGGDCGPV
jgi:hypothetical protein